MTKAQSITYSSSPFQARPGKIHSVELSENGEQVIALCTGRVIQHSVPVADDKAATCKFCAAKGA